MRAVLRNHFLFRRDFELKSLNLKVHIRIPQIYPARYDPGITKKYLSGPYSSNANTPITAASVPNKISDGLPAADEGEGAFLEEEPLVGHEQEAESPGTPGGISGPKGFASSKPRGSICVTGFPETYA